MKTIYFNLKSNLRERMYATVEQAKKIYNVSVPNLAIHNNAIGGNKERRLKSILDLLKKYLRKFLIHRQRIKIKNLLNPDVIYMWGAFPTKISNRFIIELDNPYVLTYYSSKNFYRNKERIRFLLNKAHKIVCLSETCRNHLVELIGNDILNKTAVLYPYIPENHNNRFKHSHLNFIFIGIPHRPKGSFELLEAFHHLKEKSIKLTIVSDIDEETKRKYANDERIVFLPPQTHNKLLKDIYPNMDILISPSFYESFGVVLLEALSFGMAVIAVNNYATPEMVIDNFNGKLLKHPILKPVSLNGVERINCVDLTHDEFVEKYLNDGEFYHGLYCDLKSSIEEAIDLYYIWQKNSLTLFNNIFAPNYWYERFKNIIEL